MYLALNSAVSEFLSRPKYLLDSATVSEAVEFMQENKIGSVLVVNESVELVGIFTERDVLLKVACKGDAIREEPVANYMTKNPKTMGESQTAEEAAKMMQAGNFRHIPIVNEINKPVGIISIKDLFQK